jgi:hypothetical protein
MNRLAATGALTAALVAPAVATASAVELQYIYYVEASRCASLPEPRTLTGFQVEKLDGIVTALHGVVGCQHITARHPETNRWYSGLTIRRVDVDRDVALLEVPGLPRGGGLKPSASGEPAGAAVVVLGHPAAVQAVWDMPLTLSERVLRTLESFLPPALNTAARKRRSPSLDIHVLALNGPLQPGHSGAPVLDAVRRDVLGVGSGGIGDGTLNIGWAIPISQITWQAPADVTKEGLTVAQRLDELAGIEPTDLWLNRDPDQPTQKPVERSSGVACLGQTMRFDLDRGDSRPSDAEADLFLNARTFSERYLQPWGAAALAVIGDRDFERVTPEALKRAPLSGLGLNASRDARNALPPGTVLAVRTGAGRYAKLQIVSSQGDAVSFKWVTYALPSEGPSPLAPHLEPCSEKGLFEATLLCGTGRLPGDAITSFRVLDNRPDGLVVALRHSYAPAHGSVWIGSKLLDKDGASLHPGYFPTAALSTGETVVRVVRGGDRTRQRYVLFWLYEAHKSEAFVCRRFDFR